jgi:hypothetical protein
MEESIIKSVADAGMGVGSLLVLGGVFIYQLKTNREIMAKMSDKLDEHSSTMREVVTEMREGRQVNIEMLKSMQGCKHNQIK